MTDPNTGTTRMSLRTLVWLAIGILVALFAISAAFSVYGRLVVRASIDDLADHLLPAQRAVAGLVTAYVDQETGQRGYVLTGDPRFLDPYDTGRDKVAALMSNLNTELARDPDARSSLTEVVEAADAWTVDAAEPQIAARRGNATESEQVAATTAAGKELFDALRSRLDVLSARTDALVAVQVDRVRSAQILANVATAVAFSLTAVTAVTAIYLTRRLLARPIENLVADISAVAGGDYERTIAIDGPREVAAIGEAVDTMRTSLLDQNRLLLQAEHERTRHDEQDRMAADLHDLTLQRVFGLGLALTSLARRHPRRAVEFDPLIDETDSIVRGLRAVIFDLTHPTADTPPKETPNLSSEIGEIVESSAAALGFIPDISLEGPVDSVSDLDAGPELQAVLREALSNVARHAQASVCSVRVTAGDDRITLHVTDNGTGIPADAARGNGLANIENRAEQLGGHAVIRDASPGTMVEWEVPTT
ncbi:CHASE3 domain-containing protein [Rhodococcus sp. USK10]|uniref:CHASE3 domain-containing protein n=1 Tax=Rhodococcus sp. USK10 TaxID=2789739 RepID=UPI001C6004C4|nr:CHASE3 domain-containing protein [Rhodococcus sp. USK10]QYB04656.1 CHASE3 domain-containing protein [Rhodococcus sp. USK10]